MAPTFHQAGCCCPAVCEYCDGTVPSQWEVTFSDVENCLQCAGGSGPGDHSWAWITEPSVECDGSFTLEWVSDCLWRVIVPCTGEWGEWYDTGYPPNCTGDPDKTTQITSLTITLEIEWDRIKITALYAPLSATHFYQYNFWNDVDDDICVDTAVMDNTHVQCPVVASSGIPTGVDGSASAEPL